MALGQRERLPALIKLLDSEDAQVRYAVINAFRESVRPEEKEQVVDALRTMLQHEGNPGLHTDATQFLHEISGCAGTAGDTPRTDRSVRLLKDVIA